MSDNTLFERFQDPVSVLYEQGISLFEDKNTGQRYSISQYDNVLKKLAKQHSSTRSVKRAGHNISNDNTCLASPTPIRGILQNGYSSTTQMQSHGTQQPPLPIRNHTRSGVKFTRQSSKRTSVVFGPNGRRRATRGISHFHSQGGHDRANSSDSRRSRESSGSDESNHALHRGQSSGDSQPDSLSRLDNRHSNEPKFSDLILIPRPVNSTRASQKVTCYTYNSNLNTQNPPPEISPETVDPLHNKHPDHPYPKPCNSSTESPTQPCAERIEEAEKMVKENSSSLAFSGRSKPRHRPASKQKQVLNKELPPLPPLLMNPAAPLSAEDVPSQGPSSQGRKRPPPPIIISAAKQKATAIAVGPNESRRTTSPNNGTDIISNKTMWARDGATGVSRSASPEFFSPTMSCSDGPKLDSAVDSDMELTRQDIEDSVYDDRSDSQASLHGTTPTSLFPPHTIRQVHQSRSHSTSDGASMTENIPASSTSSGYAGLSTINVVIPSPSSDVSLNSHVEHLGSLETQSENSPHGHDALHATKPTREHQDDEIRPFSPAKRDSNKTENTYVTNGSSDSLLRDKATVSTQSSVQRRGSLDESNHLKESELTVEESGSIYVNSMRRSVSAHERPVINDKIVPADPGSQPRIKNKFNLIRELVDTEEVFATDMAVVLDIYARRLSGERFFGYVGREDMISLFSNTEKILLLSRQFVTTLRHVISPYVFDSKVALKETQLADVETRIGGAVRGYVPAMEAAFQIYCNNNRAQMETFVKVKALACPIIDRWLWECFEDSKSLTSAWTLDSLLIKPVQRLLKYPLLVKSLLKDTPEGHPDYQDLKEAVCELQACADRINAGDIGQDDASSSLLLSSLKSPALEPPQSAKSASSFRHSHSAANSKRASILSSSSGKNSDSESDDYKRLPLDPNADSVLRTEIQQFQIKKKQLLDLANAFRNNAYTIQGHFDCNNKLAKSWLNWVNLPEETRPLSPTTPGLPSSDSKTATDHRTEQAADAQTKTQPESADSKHGDKRYKSFASFSTPFLSNTQNPSSLSSARLVYKMERDVLAPLDKAWAMYERTEALIAERLRYHPAYAKYIASKKGIDGGGTNVYYMPRDPSQPSQQLSTVEKQKADLFMKYHNSLTDGLPDLLQLTEEVVEAAMSKYISIQRRWFRLAVDSMATVFQIKVGDIKDVNGNKDRDPILEKYRKRDDSGHNRAKEVVEQLRIVQRQGKAAENNREDHRYDDEEYDHESESQYGTDKVSSYTLTAMNESFGESSQTAHLESDDNTLLRAATSLTSLPTSVDSNATVGLNSSSTRGPVTPSADFPFTEFVRRKPSVLNMSNWQRKKKQQASGKTA